MMEDLTKNSIADCELMDWVVPLGSYDCLMNAILYWLSVNHADTNPLYRYNFSINYCKRYDLFEGSVPMNELFNFIQSLYGVVLNHVRLDGLAHRKTYLLPVDAYYLSYMTEYFDKGHMLHYVLAEAVSAHSLMIVDPYFKTKKIVDFTAADKAWRTFSEPIIELGLPSNLMPDLTCIKPYLTTEPYPDILTSTFTQIAERMMVFGAYRDSADLMSNPLFKKQFGCIRTIALSRFKHVGTYRTLDYAHLSSAWRKLEVNFMKMTISLDKGLTATLNNLNQIADDELSYLHSYSKG